MKTKLLHGIILFLAPVFAVLALVVFNFKFQASPAKVLAQSGGVKLQDVVLAVVLFVLSGTMIIIRVNKRQMDYMQCGNLLIVITVEMAMVVSQAVLVIS